MSSRTDGSPHNRPHDLPNETVRGGSRSKTREQLGRYIRSLRDGQIPHWPDYMSAQEYRFVEILSSIPDCPSGIRVLDIGTTPFTFFIKRLHPNYEISTLDISDLMEDWCKEEHVDFRMCNLATQPIPFQDEYFDLIVFTEVLEHLPTVPSATLKEVRRVMRQGGKLILSVPNIAALHCRLMLLFGVTPLSYLAQGARGHLHVYTKHEITSELSRCGFAVSRSKYLQPSVKHALKESRRSTFGLVTAFCYVTELLLIAPSFRVTIYIESNKLAEVGG